MKRLLISVMSLASLVSCMNDEKYESYNRDPKNPTQVEAEFLFNSGSKSLFDQMASTNVNTNVFRLLAQYWTEVTYVDEANYDLNNRNITANHWSEMYRDVLLDLEDAKRLVSEDADLTAAEKATRIAQAEILIVYTWQQMVDSFGDIPYSEALDPATYTLPKYDDAATIYADLITRITVAAQDLSEGGFPIDNIYGGDIDAWKKFANSVKLRLGIRLTDVNPSLAQSTVESAVAAGVFTSNDDNAILEYEGAAPNTNPLWLDLVQSGRSDYVPANTVVDYMNTLQDPRRVAYFDDNLGEGVYVGGTYGKVTTFAAVTHIGDLMYEPTFPGVLMDFSEVSFYLAEAAQRGFNVGGSVEEHYNNGITASFEYWGVDGASDYLAKPEVAFATAAGDWRQKIGTQMWLAMYNRGFEGWTAWRKFDAPALNIPERDKKPVPFRYTYPVNEQTLNPDQWQAASQAIGGDLQSTKIFWDVN